MKRNLSSFLLCLLSVCLILCGSLQSGYPGFPEAGTLYSSEGSCQTGEAEQTESLRFMQPASGQPGASELSLPAYAGFPAVAVPEKMDTGPAEAEKNIQSEGSYSFRGVFSGAPEEDTEALSFSLLGALLFTLLLMAARSLFCPHLLVQARILSFIHSQDGLK